MAVPHKGQFILFANRPFCWNQVIWSLGQAARTGTKSNMLKLTFACFVFTAAAKSVYKLLISLKLIFLK